MSDGKKSVIRMDNINKSYGRVKVLHSVKFDLRQGEIHGLVGKNGAGKSTLMKILFGVETCDSGNIEVFDVKGISGKSKYEKHESIAMIFQELSLISTLTVAQNIFLTNPPKNNLFFLDLKRSNQLAGEILKRLNVDIDPNEVVEDLSIADKQIVEIAKALEQKKKILIMDEPTTSFTRDQIEIFFRIIKNLKSQGVSIIYISHSLGDIFSICDRITIIRDGRSVSILKIKETTMEAVIERMTGSKMKTKKGREDIVIKNIKNKEPLLEVQNISFGKKVSDVSFKLYPGEVLGIAGLTGSGRTELLEGIYGINHLDQGDIFIKGKKIPVLSPKKSLEIGLSLVPDERQLKGLVVDHSVSENIVLPIIDKMKKLLFISTKRIFEIVETMIKKLNIVVSDNNQAVMSLSGGNQQKVVLSKSFSADSNIILMDDPTAGIDIESKQEIMEIAKKHVVSDENGIIISSSELEVLEDICDRILIVKKGKIIDEIENTINNRITENRLISLIQ